MDRLLQYNNLVALPTDVLTYLKACKAASQDTDSTIAHLASTGWSPEIMAEAKAWYTVPAPTPKSPKQHARLATFFIPVIIVILLLASSSLTLAYVVPISSWPAPIAQLVSRLPFKPKSVKEILDLSYSAHQQVKQATIDLSLASNTETLASLIGSNKLDFRTTGYVDFSILTNPKFSLKILLNTDLDLDLKKSDTNLYFKINHLPATLLAMVGIDPSTLTPILKNWVVYDTAPLQTEARDKLNATESDKPNPLTKTQQKTVTALLTEKVYPELKLSEVTLEGKSNYLITANLSPQLFDEFAAALNDGPNPYGSSSKPSDYIQDFAFSLWIDKSTYLLSKSEVTFTTNSTAPYVGLPSYLPSTPSSAQVAFAAKFTGYNSTQTIDLPTESISLDEFFFRITSQSSLYSARLNTAAQTKIISDLHTVGSACLMYAAENDGNYPSSLGHLIEGNYIIEIPPSINLKYNSDTNKLLLYAQDPSPTDPTKNFLVWTPESPQATPMSQSEISEF